MNTQGTDRKKELKEKIVVIGGGGAGLAAAIAAAENGVNNIVVLEKRGATGGISATASGPFGAESPAQRRQAIIAPRDVLFKRMMAWTHLTANPRIVRAFIDKSGDTIGWLEEKGLYFYCVPHSPTDDPYTWHVPKGDGAAIMKVLAAECEKYDINILLDTSAGKILTGPNGVVTGVQAEKGSETITIETGCVIIGTGGFGGNQEMLEKYCSGYRSGMKPSPFKNVGDGLNLALEAGAATDGLGMLMAAGPVADHHGLIHLGTGEDTVPINMTFISGEPYAVWVNKNGKRFCDETAIFNYYESINALVRQPDVVSYSLFDTAAVQRMSEKGLYNLATGLGYGEKQRSKLPPGLEQELQKLGDTGAIKAADNWEAIADWIGADRKVLVNTLEEYNTACDHGYDPVFAKDRMYLAPLRQPPYYAIRCTSVILNTMGGIKINEYMEVLDKNNNPIPGLYAAGVDTGGWTSDTYCAALPGTAFGYALNSGRIAGESAFKYIEIDG